MNTVINNSNGIVCECAGAVDAVNILNIPPSIVVSFWDKKSPLCARNAHSGPALSHRRTITPEALNKNISKHTQKNFVERRYRNYISQMLIMRRIG